MDLDRLREVCFGAVSGLTAEGVSESLREAITGRLGEPRRLDVMVGEEVDRAVAPARQHVVEGGGDVAEFDAAVALGKREIVQQIAGWLTRDILEDGGRELRALPPSELARDARSTRVFDIMRRMLLALLRLGWESTEAEAAVAAMLLAAMRDRGVGPS